MRKINFILEPSDITEIINSATSIAELLCIKIYADKRKNFITFSFDTKRQPGKALLEFDNIDIKGPSDFTIDFEKENNIKFINDLQKASAEIIAINIPISISIKKQQSEFNFKYASTSIIKKNTYFLDIVYNNSSRERFRIRKK